MKIKVLDRSVMGYDLPFDKLSSFGEVEIYDTTYDAELDNRLSDAEIIVLNKIKITRVVMEKAKKLKLICVFATGYDNIDVCAAAELGITVCNVPAYSTESVALFTVASVLSLITHLEEYRSFVSGGEYTARGLANSITPVYHEIAGKKWGVVGYGNIGKRVAAIAEVFGAEVLVCKRTPEDGVRVVDIDTLCAECDIITVHTPLTKSTRGMIGEGQISVMKNTAILVNAARGAVLDEAAVASAVKDGRIGAFGSDVYSSEPFSKEHPFYEIKDYKNVCLTPHAAWAAYEARVRCLEVICDNINGYLSNKIINSVNNL